MYTKNKSILFIYFSFSFSYYHFETLYKTTFFLFEIFNFRNLCTKQIRLYESCWLYLCSFFVDNGDD